MTAQPDSLIRFLLPDAGVRGVHVRLQATWQEILSHAHYPDAAAELLGEACVASALFTLYSLMLGSSVFVVTNLLLLATALLGQVLARHRQRQAPLPPPC
jgi:redox-regulated HSP33 family molecular chaperone